MRRATTAGALLHAARRAPCVDLAALIGDGPVLVLAPHPDDETLGCGGLIAACRHAGIRVDVALLTDGAGSHPGSRTHPPARLSCLRIEEMAAGLAELGVAREALHPLGWPDQQAPTRGPALGAAVDQVVALLRASGAGTLVTTWRHDPHCDHEAAAMIAAQAARLAPVQHLACPVWGWTLPPETPVDHGRALRLEISRCLPQKRRAIACHHSQHGRVVRDDPGFTLPAALLRACLTRHEVFFDETHG